MCADLLNVAKAKRGEKMFEPRRSNGIKDGYFMYEMVDEILWEAAELEQQSAEKLRSDSTLAKVAEFLEEWLKDEKAVLVDSARLATGISLARNEEERKEVHKLEQDKVSKGEVTMELCGGKLQLATVSLPEELETMEADIRAERQKKADKRKQKKFRTAPGSQAAQAGVEVPDEVYSLADEDLKDKM